MLVKFIQSFIVLFTVWMLLTGGGGEEMVAGVFFSLLVAYAAKDYIFKEGILSKLHPLRLMHSLRFFSIYFWNELVNHLRLCLIILDPKADIHPTLVRAPFMTKNTKVMTAVANAVTLTPGTFALDISEKELLIHCIDFKKIDALGDMRSYELALMRVIE